MIPQMVKKGYDRGFSAGITVASSTMGMIIPPSVPMLTYSMISGASVGALFMAGLIPGILIGLSQIIISKIISKKNNYNLDLDEELKDKNVFNIAKEGILALVMASFNCCNYFLWNCYCKRVGRGSGFILIYYWILCL